MLRLLALSWFGLVYLTITAHCSIAKRSASGCTTTIAEIYCRNFIQSSRNPSGNCKDGAIVCYMTSPICRKAEQCEEACGPLALRGIYVKPECVRNQCVCEVEDECTDSGCKAACVKQLRGKRIESWRCLRNNSCICHHTEECTSEDDCKSVCEEEYPGEQFTSTQCQSDGTCFCKYLEPCTGDAYCKSVCEKKYPGKRMLSTRCGRDKQCLCEYLIGGATFIAGSAGTLRPSELIVALILLTALVKIPAPAQGKLWALLILPATFGLPISQLAWG